MQLDAVKGRLLNRSETAIAAPSGRRRRELPLVFAAMKIFVRAGSHKAVEAPDSLLQLAVIDPEFCRQLRHGGGARHRLRHCAADRPVGERIFLQILRIENQIGGQVGIFMPPRIEQTKLRHDPLKEGFIGKAPAMLVHQ